MSEKKEVLAMYDVRGIQNYIFRTSKLKDAIGASAIVETIITDALQAAVDSLGITSSEIEWEQKEYNGENKAVQVLYIGGGNAYVVYESEELCLQVNRVMAKYVLENTYSLQLAVAFVNKSENYLEDYKNLNRKMAKIKADMPDSKPVGALPVIEVELATGLPSTGSDICLETQMKRDREAEVRKKIKSKNKKFDSYIEEKGEDSTLAVIHIDGNNMGKRIRNLISKETNYVKAVNKMREVSYNIDHSYKEVFEQMAAAFNKGGKHIVLKVLTAGDDITYVCNGKAAVASVEYFVEHIKTKSMYDNNIQDYGFSVCGGIAFIRSHFPFSIAYQVAEACCESAKDRAKANAVAERVGNFFDFQFCKNVQTMDIDSIRKNEYLTASGESLLIRPYEIGGDPEKFYCYDKLKAKVSVFAGLNDEKKKTEEAGPKDLPRSHAKKLRNLYSLGEVQVNSFRGFLESRKWKMPAENMEMYLTEGTQKIAKYYDALELMDVYMSLDDILKENAEEENT